MSKNTIGTIISCVSFLVYAMLAILQYRSYVGVFQGKMTIGGYVAAQSMFNSYATWLVKIAAFFPLVVFFRRMLRWNRGARCGILILSIIVPLVISAISTPLYSQSLNLISNGVIMSGAFWMYQVFGVISGAISTLVYVAAAKGIGLLGKIDYQKNTSIDSITTENSSSYSYLEQYKQKKKNGGI